LCEYREDVTRAIRKKLELLFLVFKELPPLRVKKLLNVHHMLGMRGDAEEKLTDLVTGACCEIPYIGSQITTAEYKQALLLVNTAFCSCISALREFMICVISNAREPR
jgi:hypothetical protein